MTTGNLDITQRVISRDYIYSNLSSIFPDSVFLNPNFKILGSSVNVQQSLGYTGEELCEQSFSRLEETGELEQMIRKRLAAGFFSGVEVELKKKLHGTVRFSVSGFYLGLISDLSGIIVLKFSNLEEVTMLDRQLQLTKNQLDNFIYRTAHDIRGPLATIQGLANLIKIRKDETEVDRFNQLIDAHAKKLDERLSQLVYLAHVDEEEVKPRYVVDFYEMETHLRKVIEQNAFLDFLELNFVILLDTLVGLNEELLKKLLTNLLLHILSLQKKDTTNQVTISCDKDPSLLTIRIKAIGFLVDPTIQKGINEGGASMYTDLLKHSKLAHVFAAQKIAWKLKASIQFDSTAEAEQCLTISIPLVAASPNSAPELHLLKKADS